MFCSSSLSTKCSISEKLIYRLDMSTLGCIYQFPVWEMTVLGLASVLVMFLIMVINRQWKKLKFYAFVHFDILTKDDEPEDLKDIEFDGYITYRFE